MLLDLGIGNTYIFVNLIIPNIAAVWGNMQLGQLSLKQSESIWFLLPGPISRRREREPLFLSMKNDCSIITHFDLADI